MSVVGFFCGDGGNGGGGGGDDDGVQRRFIERGSKANFDSKRVFSVELGAGGGLVG